VDVQMGTFSKALGCQGGYVAGSREVMDWLVNRARSFVYSTAMTPALAEAIGAAVCWVWGEEGEGRRVQLRGVVDRFRARFRRELGGRLVGDAARLFEASCSAIVPLVVGGAADAVALSERLLERGYWVPAVRYPTVPEGLARLRFSLNARLSEADLEGVVAAFGAT
jgi:7-keto-8-aminopelargonate synthetase-like enzyme